jgi:hypothetical protein
MNPDTEYQVEKRGKFDQSSIFLSLKLNASLRSAMQQHPQDSSVEFTSQDAGMIHIGNESHQFSIRKDAKMEIYEIVPSPASASVLLKGVTNTQIISFIGPISGKVIVHREAKGITSEETALIRQKTIDAETKAKNRQTMIMPNLLKPSTMVAKTGILLSVHIHSLLLLSLYSHTLTSLLFIFTYAHFFYLSLLHYIHIRSLFLIQSDQW